MYDTINLHSWKKCSFLPTNFICNTISGYYTIKTSLTLMDIHVANSHYIMAQYRKQEKVLLSFCYLHEVRREIISQERQDFHYSMAET
jgi:hypothetical protein